MSLKLRGLISNFSVCCLIIWESLKCALNCNEISFCDCTQKYLKITEYWVWFSLLSSNLQTQHGNKILNVWKLKEKEKKETKRFKGLRI